MYLLKYYEEIISFKKVKIDCLLGSAHRVKLVKKYLYPLLSAAQANKVWYIAGRS